MTDASPEVKVEVVRKNPRKPTKKYELQAARYDGIDDEGKAKRFVAGDFVPLTENEYAAFGDKFGAEESRVSRNKLNRLETEPQVPGQRPSGPQSQPTTANPQSPGKVPVPANPVDPTKPLNPDQKSHV